MFERIKYYYDIGIYTKEQVALFVFKNKITPEQYKLITNENYEPSR